MQHLGPVVDARRSSEDRSGGSGEEGSDEMPALPGHAQPRELANLPKKKKKKDAQNKTLRRRSEEPLSRGAMTAVTALR